ncbi:MAG: hypothetical protein QXD66_07230 [Candidatus Nezhaarchaeales archaeon]|nr:MAG: hypothetical protein DSO06_05515 [Candidatus Nezhaarchaeota archaeon WYZ-LMO8]TDA35465.1 MAG: hypothetical protein DSO05_05260 [Candidatus Nezhaarchaeota archaeon WYZ-LMO7]
MSLAAIRLGESSCLGCEYMIRQLREGYYRVVSYFQKIKSLVRRGRESRGSQKLMMNIASDQQLEGGVIEENVEAKEVKRKGAKKARKSTVKKAVKKRRARSTRKRAKKRRAKKSRR